MGMLEAVVSGLGPAGAVFLAYLLVHRAAWQREDRHRNHEARVEAYKGFMWICNRVYNDETGEDTFLELRHAYYVICLVAGSKEVMRSAERLTGVLDPLPSNDHPEKRSKHFVKPEKYSERVDDFFDKARKDLGNSSMASWFLDADFRKQFQSDSTERKALTVEDEESKRAGENQQ